MFRAFRRIRFSLAILLGLFSVGLFVFARWPVSMQSAEIPLFVVPSVQEFRLVRVDEPDRVMIGDPAPLRIELTASSTTDESSSSEVRFFDHLYEGTQVRIEARLEMPGVDVQPPGVIQQPLRQGQAVSYVWRLEPQRTGNIEGTLWLHLIRKPDSGGMEDKTAILARTIHFTSHSVLGLSPKIARWVALSILLLALLLALPWIQSKALGWISQIQSNQLSDNS